MIRGMAKAYPEYLKKMEDELVLVRAQKKSAKVALISGGGSGHEPAHGGYVGYGMLDGAVAGPVYTSPSVEPIYKGIKAVDAGAGVLMVIKNYTGDVMNFEMAGEQAGTEDGIRVAQVIVNDDVAVKDSTWTTGRRGVAGTVFVHKIAGAKAESGASLEEVQAVAQKTIDRVRTMGVGIKPCVVPAAGIPGFTLAEDEMEIGIGIHGEPGVRKEKMKSADEIVDELLDRILEDLDYSGSEVAVMVNGCGGTPLMELYIVNHHVADVLQAKGISVYRTFVGNYMTSIEMEGFSVSLLKLDEELKTLLDAPCDTPAFKVGRCDASCDKSALKEGRNDASCNTPALEEGRNDAPCDTPAFKVGRNDAPARQPADEDAKCQRAGRAGENESISQAEEQMEDCAAVPETADQTKDYIAVPETADQMKAGFSVGQENANTVKVIGVLQQMISTMGENAAYLTELDNVIGDGDHGINMNRGFQAVAARLQDYEKMTPDEILSDVGKVLMKTVGGSSGPLYGSAFKKCGTVLKGRDPLGIAELLEMLEASAVQIKKLGKSDEKDKTMLDAICPALRAMKEAAAEGGSSEAVLHAGITAAEQGIAYTKTIAARKGRASYLGDRSIGHADPGAVSFTLLLKAVSQEIY